MAVATVPDNVRAFLKREHGMLIGGEWKNANASLDVIDPSTGERISEISEAAEADVDDAVAAARNAFEAEEWSSFTPQARMRLLRRIGDLIEQHADELAFLETLDAGKPIMMSKPVDVMASAGAFHYYAGWADKIHGTTHNISMPGEHHAFTLKEPVGVAALITPWNYPMVMAAMKLAPALAAGCTCILKPAEDTSLTAIRLGELMIEAGVPAGVVNIVTGRGAISGAALSAHPGVDKVAFTGSTATGKAIAQAATGNLKKVTLELGGKSPNIILADADLEKAIPAAAMAVFFNTGQTCTAVTRLYVEDKVYDQVVEGIAGVAKSLKVGGGLEEDTVMGPVISERQLTRVKSYIDKGREEGGEIIAGGGQIGDKGFFIEPTVIAQTSNDMTIVKEEIFGPVLAAQKFSGVDEVVSLANDSSYGLSSSVWTQNITHAHQIARRLRTGQVAVNTAAVADWDLPIGGYKQSGWGRENGYDAVENYLQTKSVAVAL